MIRDVASDGSGTCSPAAFGETEEDLESFDGCGHTLAAQRLAFVCEGHHDAIRFRLVEDCLGKRVAGAGLQGGSQPEDVLLATAEADDIGHLGLALGEGAGLVEAGGGDLPQPFQDGTALHEKAPARSGGEPGRDGGGSGDHQGARAADQEDGEALIDPLVPSSTEQERRDDRDEGRDHHHAGACSSGRSGR